MNDKKRAVYRQTLVIFIGLLILTLLESAASAQLQNALVVLMIIALIKAALIVNYFMHIYRLWRQEDH